MILNISDFTEYTGIYLFIFFCFKKNLFRRGVYHLIKLAHIFAGNHSLLPTPSPKL